VPSIRLHQYEAEAPFRSRGRCDNQAIRHAVRTIYVAPYDKILIVCASFIFDLDTPFDSAHRELSYEAISTSI